MNEDILLDDDFNEYNDQDDMEYIEENFHIDLEGL